MQVNDDSSIIYFNCLSGFFTNNCSNCLPTKIFSYIASYFKDVVIPGMTALANKFNSLIGRVKPHSQTSSCKELFEALKQEAKKRLNIPPAAENDCRMKIEVESDKILLEQVSDLKDQATLYIAYLSLRFSRNFNDHHSLNRILSTLPNDSEISKKIKATLSSLIENQSNPHQPVPSSNQAKQKAAYENLNKWAQEQPEKYRDFLSLIQDKLNPKDPNLADIRYKWYITYWLYRLESGTVDQCLSQEGLNNCRESLPGRALFMRKLDHELSPLLNK